MANITRFNNLKIQLLSKYRKDWIETYSLYIPANGEICVVQLTPEESLEVDGVRQLLKVGDGIKRFEELDYVGARAADVKDWAKKNNLDYTDLDDIFMSKLDAHIDQKTGTALTGYATEDWVENKNYATESWVDNKGYLTEHQSLDEYAKIQYVDTKIANLDAKKENKIGPDNKVLYDYIDGQLSLNLEIDPNTFAFKAMLYDPHGNVISTSDIIDLPLELVVVSGEYDVQARQIVLTLKNGNTITIPLYDLVDGLVNKSVLDSTLANYDKTVVINEKLLNLKSELVASISSLDSKVDNAVSTVEANYKAADKLIRDELVAEDARIEREYKVADELITTAYTIADATVTEAFKNADNALSTELKAADAKIINDYIAADSVVTANFETADLKVRDDFTLADLNLHDEFIAADVLIRADFKAADDSIKSDLVTAKNTLLNLIDSVNSQLSSNITTVLTNLNKEVSDRTSADTLLLNNITTLDNSLAVVAKSGRYEDLINKPTKVSEFENDKDFVLTTSMNLAIAESATGVKADLNARITTVYTELNDKIAETKDDVRLIATDIVTDEIINRKEADKELSDAIDNETTARTTSDLVIIADLNTEIAERLAAIQSETNLRTLSDNELQANIDAEASIRELKDKELNDSLAAIAKSGSYNDLKDFPTNFSIISETGNKLSLSLSTTDFKLTIGLLDKNSNVLDSKLVDFPLETMVIGALYDNETKELVISLKSGETVRVPIGSLIDGLVSQTSFDSLSGNVNAIRNDLTNEVTYRNSRDTEIHNLLSDKLDKLTAGTDIDITNNVISVTGQVWENGTGLNSVLTIQSEANKNNAAGEASVSEGAATDAHSFASHAEGYMTSTGTDAQYSHAEGYKTSTLGVASHAEGDNTVTNNPAEHAEGRYNKSNMGGTDATNTISSIGIGNGSTEIPGGNRKNAVEVMQNGDMYVLGIGDYDGLNFSLASTVLEVLNEKLDLLETGEGINITDRYISIDTNVIADVEFVNEQINAINTAKQDKLTAGTGVEITNNVISSTVNGLPNYPTDNGVYILLVTVMDGNPVLEWISKE